MEVSFSNITLEKKKFGSSNNAYSNIKYLKNKEEYFKNKPRLIREGIIISGKWIIYDDGEILKQCDTFGELKIISPYHFVARVNYEDLFPSIQKKTLIFRPRSTKKDDYTFLK